MKEPNFDSQRRSPHATMTVNGLKVEFNMPDALESVYVNGEEIAQQLPPYRVRRAFLVDTLPNAPSEWVRSEPGYSSYVVPVKPNHGMWLDFNSNREHTHDVAVVISIQGANALTSFKTDELRLEQYRETCPECSHAFVADRFCPECKQQFPPQNYLCTTGTPDGQFWLDGFLASDGVTRQWVITEDEFKSVAKAILGEKRVFAIGVMFYLSREPKPVPPKRVRAAGPAALAASSGFEPANAFDDEEIGACLDCSDMVLGASADFDDDMVLSAASASFGNSGSDETESIDSMLCEFTETAIDFTEAELGADAATEPQSSPPKVVKKLEIGKGARIDQAIHPDRKDLSYWQDEPAGMVVITYVDENTYGEVLKAALNQDTSFLGKLNVPQAN